ncbi:MAG: hypothetical protein V4515_08785 [Chloroflexota bacterium]
MDAPPAERTPGERIVALAPLVGLFAIGVGLVVLGPSDIGFQAGPALTALATWIPVTLPGGLLVLLVTMADVGAGVVIARGLRGRPFERIDEAILQGFAFAVIKDVMLLGVLAGSGLFIQPILLAVEMLLLGAGVFRFRPILQNDAFPGVGRVTFFGVLIVVVWASPILLQLASPVVPFIDVLPNHVAPAEHLRTFGTLSLLTDTQSPIYGSSRIFIGYTAFAGMVTSISGLPAGQALAGLILPSTLLVAVAVHRLARALGGSRITGWALLLFAITAPFARLGDARATVIVLPLVALVLAGVAERIAESSALVGPPSVEGSAADRRSRYGAPIMAGLGLGAALLMHPAVGSLAALTLLITVLLRPAAGGLVIPALGIGAVVAVPQLATTVGVPLPPVALVAGLLGGVAVGVALVPAAAWHARLIRLGRLLLIPLGLGSIASIGALVPAAGAGAEPLLSVMELSTVAALVAVGLRAPAARQPVVWAALGAGFGVAMLTQLVPTEGAGLLGEALRFELPKTLHYWVPAMMAILAAAGLDALVTHRSIPAIIRGGVAVAFLAMAALPIRAAPIDWLWLGEHRYSETLSIAMRAVQNGFWRNYPDTRYVVDGPRREILDAVRAEIDAGRIGPDTPILHVARSFQQWQATPIGVFDGVTETTVTPDAVVNIHTVGGRLRPLDDLAGLLAGGAYPYVLLEPSPDDLPADVRDMIVAASYSPVFRNGQGELFSLAGR